MPKYTQVYIHTVWNSIHTGSYVRATVPTETAVHIYGRAHGRMQYTFTHQCGLMSSLALRTLAIGISVASMLPVVFVLGDSGSFSGL